jgi:hypothetical protein
MSECGCISGFYDHDSTAISVHRLVARKDHKCGECADVIHPGDTYERYVGKDNGSAWTAKTCQNCLSIRDEFVCGSWLFGELLNMVGEHVEDMEGEISSECLLRITPVARGVVIDMIDECWKETTDE